MMPFPSVPACLLNVLPVVHPPHLEGDASLATEILPGPPSLESIRQFAKKNEPRKLPLPSYLPFSDPGTTYTSLAGGMVAMGLDEGGPRTKRARIDKRSLSNRAQRASARNLTGNATANGQASMSAMQAASFQLGQDDVATMDDDDRSTSHSRSTSIPLNGETRGQSVPGNGSRKSDGKGKGKEKEDSEKIAQVRVKEEPIPLQLSDIPTTPTNQDHCSSCSSVGALVYCDGCPRAFHLWCLDPPMDPSDFPEGNECWYCPGCEIDKTHPKKSSRTFLAPLIQQLENTIPTEFRLPEEIRTFFRDVGTGPGGSYVDNSTVKAIRVGRHGHGEERDPYRLKDNKGVPVLCFRCGKSALPDDPVTGHSTTGPRRASVSQSEHWKGLLSCDFCPLHWHVDCLEPPMTSYPPINRKWKCPNHASNSAPKMRIPRGAAPPIDITEAHQRNNGNIEIINSDISTRPEEKMPIDEVLINGRRYRVPERVIVLDFWNKVKQQRVTRFSEHTSIVSSPLTSLSSLDEQGDRDPPPLKLDLPDKDDETLQVATLLCRLQSKESQVQPRHRPLEKKGQPERDHGTFKQPRSKEFGPVLSVDKNDKFAFRSSQNASSASSTKPSSKKRTLEGRRVPSSHSPRHTSKSSSSILKASVNPSLHGPKAIHSSAIVNGVRDASSDGLVVRTYAPNDKVGAKPSVSPFKIRIPSRVAQKQTNGSISTTDSSRPSLSLSSLQARPRRSLRRQTPMNGTGSEHSISIDHCHDGRS